jgi:hypothetical protein
MGTDPVSLEALDAELKRRRHVGVVVDEIRLHILQPLPVLRLCRSSCRRVQAVRYPPSMNDDHNQSRPGVDRKRDDRDLCEVGACDGLERGNKVAVGGRGKKNVDVGFGQRHSPASSIADDSVEEEDGPSIEEEKKGGAALTNVRSSSLSTRKASMNLCRSSAPPSSPSLLASIS